MKQVIDKHPSIRVRASYLIPMGCDHMRRSCRRAGFAGPSPGRCVSPVAVSEVHVPVTVCHRSRSREPVRRSAAVWRLPPSVHHPVAVCRRHTWGASGCRSTLVVPNLRPGRRPVSGSRGTTHSGSTSRSLCILAPARVTRPTACTRSDDHVPCAARSLTAGRPDPATGRPGGDRESAPGTTMARRVPRPCRAGGRSVGGARRPELFGRASPAGPLRFE